MNLKMKSNAKYASVLLPLLALASCGSPDLTPAAAKNEAYAASHVVFSGQDDLNTHIAVGAISRSFDSNGLMHISVPVRATTEMDLYVDYRVTYFDDNHTPVDVPTAWQTQTLHSNIFQYLQANSSTPRAKDFQVDIREAQ